MAKVSGACRASQSRMAVAPISQASFLKSDWIAASRSCWCNSSDMGMVMPGVGVGVFIICSLSHDRKRYRTICTRKRTTDARISTIRPRNHAMRARFQAITAMAVQSVRHTDFISFEFVRRSYVCVSKSRDFANSSCDFASVSCRNVRYRAISRHCGSFLPSQPEG